MNPTTMMPTMTHKAVSWIFCVKMLFPKRALTMIDMIALSPRRAVMSNALICLFASLNLSSLSILTALLCSL